MKNPKIGRKKTVWARTRRYEPRIFSMNKNTLFWRILKTIEILHENIYKIIWLHGILYKTELKLENNLYYNKTFSFKSNFSFKNFFWTVIPTNCVKSIFNFFVFKYWKEADSKVVQKHKQTTIKNVFLMLVKSISCSKPSELKYSKRFTFHFLVWWRF